MKELVIGVFEAREYAEKAINALHRELGISAKDISYLYRTTDNEVKEVQAGRVTSSTVGEGAGRGAAWGGGIGAVAGLAVAAGAIPIIGPVIAAGPLIAALGLGAGALGTAAAGAITGAAAGGLIGALVSMGMSEEHAQRYEDYVRSGNILVSAHTDSPSEATSIMNEYGAIDVHIQAPAI
jgi:uncharacterized membrane protein